MALNKEKITAIAMKHLQKGALGRAVKEFEKILTDYPNDERTLQKVGDLYARMNMQREALNAYKRVGNLYVRQGFYLKAIAVHKQILQLDPNQMELRVKLAEMYHQLGLVSDSIEQYQIIYRFYEENKRTKDALTILKQITLIDPENIANRVRLAEGLIQQGDINDGVSEYQRTLEDLSRARREDDYLRVLDRLIHHAPDQTERGKELVILYLDRGETKKAVSRLQLLLKHAPEDLGVLELLAKSFRKMKQLAKTLTVFREMARLLKSRRDYNRLQTIYQAMLEIDPENGEALKGINELPFAERVGVSSGLDSNLGESNLEEIGTLSEVDGVTPDSARKVSVPEPAPAPVSELDVKKVLTEAEVFGKYGLHDQAEERLQSLLSINPDHAEALRKLAAVLPHLGKNEEAVIALLHFAAVSVESGNSIEAREALEDAKELEAHRDAVQELIDVFEDLQDEEICERIRGTMERLGAAPPAVKEKVDDRDSIMAELAGGELEVEADEVELEFDQEKDEQHESVEEGLPPLDLDGEELAVDEVFIVEEEEEGDDSILAEVAQPESDAPEEALQQETRAYGDETSDPEVAEEAEDAINESAAEIALDIEPEEIIEEEVSEEGEEAEIIDAIDFDQEDQEIELDEEVLEVEPDGSVDDAPPDIIEEVEIPSHMVGSSDGLPVESSPTDKKAPIPPSLPEDDDLFIDEEFDTAAVEELLVIEEIAQADSEEIESDEESDAEITEEESLSGNDTDPFEGVEAIVGEQEAEEENLPEAEVEGDIEEKTGSDEAILDESGLEAIAPLDDDGHATSMEIESESGSVTLEAPDDLRPDRDEPARDADLPVEELEDMEPDDHGQALPTSDGTLEEQLDELEIVEDEDVLDEAEKAESRLDSLTLETAELGDVKRSIEYDQPKEDVVPPETEKLNLDDSTDPSFEDALGESGIAEDAPEVDLDLDEAVVADAEPVVDEAVEEIPEADEMAMDSSEGDVSLDLGDALDDYAEDEAEPETAPEPGVEVEAGESGEPIVSEDEIALEEDDLVLEADENEEEMSLDDAMIDAFIEDDSADDSDLIDDYSNTPLEELLDQDQFDEFEEAEFFYTQQVFSECLGTYEKLLTLFPEHNVLRSRVKLCRMEIEAMREQKERAQRIQDEAMENDDMGKTMFDPTAAIKAQSESSTPEDGSVNLSDEILSELDFDGDDSLAEIPDVDAGMERSSASEGENLGTHFNLGMAYQEMGLIDEAIGEFMLALNGESKRNAALMLGLLYIRKKQTTKAGEYYSIAFEDVWLTQKEFLDARYELARFYLDSGERQLALCHLQAISARNADFRNLSGLIADLSADSVAPAQADAICAVFDSVDFEALPDDTPEGDDGSNIGYV